ncbi:MAG: hypothetical protein AAF602_31380 [Myxococcota bacterium]
MSTSWPATLEPLDPFAAPLPLGVDDSPERHRLLGLWTGRSDPVATEQWAKEHGLDARMVPGKLVLPSAPRLATEEELVRITTDHDPSAGLFAPDVVLGPLADEPVDRRSLVVALAACAFVVGDGVDASPYRRYTRRAPIPPEAERLEVRAIALAPFAPFRIERLTVDTVEVSDVVGLLAASVPEGPVPLRRPGLPFGDVGPGDLLFARMARGPRGFEATVPLGVPGPLPVAFAEWTRWLTWLDVFDRQQRGLVPPPTITMVELLRRRGHMIARWTIEQRWAARAAR